METVKGLLVIPTGPNGFKKFSKKTELCSVHYIFTKFKSFCKIHLETLLEKKYFASVWGDNVVYFQNDIQSHFWLASMDHDPGHRQETHAIMTAELDRSHISGQECLTYVIMVMGFLKQQSL